METEKLNRMDNLTVPARIQPMHSPLITTDDDDEETGLGYTHTLVSFAKCKIQFDFVG